MQIKITTESVDERKYDSLVLFFFADEKPPQGACGLVDWRLNGLISQELAQGRLSGSFQEQVLLAIPRRVVTDTIMLYGLGASADLKYDQFYTAGISITQAMRGIRRQGFTLAIPDTCHCFLDPSGIIESLLVGCYDALPAETGHPASLPEILVLPSGLEKAIQGVTRFKQVINSHIEIQVITNL